ncbi:hypothetical protein ACOMHN_055965 [Nucella lapillus]
MCFQVCHSAADKIPPNHTKGPCQGQRPVGRPSAASPPPRPSPTRVIQRAPVSDVGHDMTDPLPVWGVRGRCRQGDCPGKPSVQCLTCKVCLCLNKERNCFILFHKK